MYPFLVLQFDEKLKFLDIFSKITQISNFVKIGPVVAELLQTSERLDRQT
jgi:hypothetical protein